MIRTFLLFVASGYLISSCSEEVVYNVGPDFEPYVQRFISVAKDNGVDIDFSDTGLSIVFRDAVDKETGGVCRGNHDIEIERFFWNGLTDLEKEGLIFHELGHCELFRGHRNDKLPNGEWASRMRGSPIPDGDNAVINYTGTRLDYYRTELFNENLPFPEWGSWTFDFDEYTDEQKEMVFEATDVAAFNQRLLGLSGGNFEIDVDMSSGTSEGFVGIAFMGNAFETQIRVGFTREEQFFIDSGDQVWGFMFLREKFNGLNRDRNRLTVRKIESIYQVFLNGRFIYWFDYLTPSGEVVESINTGILGEPFYHSVQVSRLP